MGDKIWGPTWDPLMYRKPSIGVQRLQVHGGKANPEPT